MRTSIDNLLTQVYELEGLLLVMQRHSDEVPQVVVDRFKEKVNQVVKMSSQLEVIHKQEPEPVVAPVKEQAPQQPVAQDEQQPQPPVFKGPEAEPIKESKPQPVKEEKRNIMAAFSINDRFLFQRELFGGDANKFDETITVIQAMHDVDQAHRFMTDDLQWDTSNDVVKEFIRLIDLGFKQ